MEKEEIQKRGNISRDTNQEGGRKRSQGPQDFPFYLWMEMVFITFCPFVIVWLGRRLHWTLQWTWEEKTLRKGTDGWLETKVSGPSPLALREVVRSDRDLWGHIIKCSVSFFKPVSWEIQHGLFE